MSRGLIIVACVLILILILILYLHPGPNIPVWSDPVAVYPPNGSAHAYYPRCLQLANGTILISYDVKRPGGPTSLELSSSNDGGTSWRWVGVIYGSSLNIADGHMAMFNGSLYCAYREVGEGEYLIGLSMSGDEGVTWSRVCTVRAGKKGLWEPFLLPLGDRLLIFYSSEEHQPQLPQVIEMRESHNGVNWTQPRIVVSSPESRDGMASVALTTDGSMLMVFESTEGRNPFSISCVGSDDGKTWTGRRLVYAPREEEKSASAPFLTYLGKGIYACSFQTDEDPTLPGIVGNAGAKMMLVRGCSRVLSGPMVLFEPSAVWNSINLLEDGRLLFATSTTMPGFSQVQVRFSKDPVRLE